MGIKDRTMKHNILTFIILAAAFISGCVNETFIDEDHGQGIKVTANIAETKTTFYSNDGITNVYWKENDAIGLFTGSQNNLKYLAKESGSSSSFKAENSYLEAEEGEAVYAYYPYNYLAKDHQIPQLYNSWQKYGEEASKDVLYASGTVSGDGVNLNFKHLFAFIKIRISLDLVSQRGPDGGLYIKSTETLALTGNSYDIAEESIVGEHNAHSLYYIIPDTPDVGENGYVDCYIAILPQPENAEISIYQYNSTETTGRIGECLVHKKVPEGGFTAGNVYTLFMKESQEAKRREEIRKVLVDLYNQTNGSRWTNKDNWCSDKPIEEWKGVYYRFPDYLQIYLSNNNLTGSIPESIGNLTELQMFNIDYNKITGKLPSSIGNLKNLEYFYINNNSLSGSLPKEFASIMDVENIHIYNNMFSGDIPQEIQDHPKWAELWPSMIYQKGNGFRMDSAVIPGPKFETTDINGKSMSSDEIYRNNKYTLIFNWTDYEYSQNYPKLINDRYDRYHKLGLEVIGWYGGNADFDANGFLTENGITLPHLQTGDRLYKNYFNSQLTIIVGSDGKVIYQNASGGDWIKSIEKIEEILGISDYESTDYSKDGEVTVLQKATKGNGIDFVLMGDGYSDELINDGTYKKIMEKAYECMFTEEPYKSFQEYFNVYMVTVVSKSEVIGKGTALKTRFGTGTHVEGDHEKCKSYAQKAIAKERMDEAHVAVIVNSVTHHGTCFLYYGSKKNDYSCGFSIGYTTTNNSDSSYCGTFLHESCGHGFAKLGDEYFYDYNGTIPSSDKTTRQNRVPYGWWKNLDFTSSPSGVKWKHFLEDERYDKEGLGVFEGGFSYPYGVWRPSEYSIMRSNSGGYNAPSREAIYYRIHKLAFGESWKYDYEKFVEYDAINRKAETRSGVPYRLPEEDFVQHTPPVIYNCTWDGQPVD